MEKKVYELIDSWRDEYVRMLQSWIRIPSVKGGAEENARLAALLRGKQEENRLLTEALAESENEISRLTRALEMAVEQLV